MTGTGEGERRGYDKTANKYGVSLLDYFYNIFKLVSLLNFENIEITMNNNVSYPVIIEVDEDGIFIVNCPSIKGCRSYGTTIEEAMENIREAIESCIDDIRPNVNKYIGIREISVTKNTPQYA